jgi:NADH:ubiquinone oxidoreductase subunit 6 (subunit J)
MASILVGAVGVLGSGVAACYLKGRASEWTPQHYWFLGLAGLFPAWLIAFLSLLQPLTQETTEAPLPPRALFSSAAALMGIIATDYLLRRMQKSGQTFQPLTYWIIGLIALFPAWLITSL